jgi:TP901 family phage tail tape measure protein
MSLLLGDMLVRYRADITDLTVKSAVAKKEISSFGDSAKKVGSLVAGGLLVAGTAALAFGVASTKMAGDYQQNVTKLYTTAGEFKDNLQMVGDGMLKMSTQVGTGALKLSEAMYWIESGGLHGKRGLEALRVAAQAAKAENADLDKVSVALVASLNAYAGQGMTDVQVMNTLTAATSQGMMTFEGLAGSLHNVLPASAKFHISLKDVTAALATMTAQADPADQAATHLRQVILAIEKPSTAGAKALRSIGLTSDQIAKEMQKSLPDALKMITDAVGKKFPEGSAAYNAAIAAIAGGSKQMMGFLELTGTHMSTFTDNVKKISAAVKQGGNDLMGWSDIQKNFNFKLDAGKAAVEALMISVGTKLLPVFGRVLDTMTPLISGFSDWITKSGFLDSAVQNTTTGLQNMITFVQSVVGFWSQWHDAIQINAVLLTVLFIPAMIKAGIEAVVASLKITYSFIASLVKTGAEGYIAAAKLAMYVGSLVATGAQATITGAIITTKFVVSLVASVVQAGAAAYMLTGSLIPALYAMGVAFYAATGPIGLAVGAIALLGVAMVAMKQKSDDMQLGMTYAVDTMGNHIQRSTGRIIQVHQTMAKQVQLSYDQMNFWGQKDTGELTTNAQNLFDKMTGHIKGDYSQLLQATKDYWNNIAAYIDNKSGLAADTANRNFAHIHYPNLSGNIISKNFGGYAGGTDSATPGYHWVGEHGKELILFNGGEQVVSSNKINHYPVGGSNSAASFGGSSGGQTIILQIDSVQVAKVTNVATDRLVRLKLAGNGRAV